MAASDDDNIVEFGVLEHAERLLQRPEADKRREEALACARNTVQFRMVRLLLKILLSALFVCAGCFHLAKPSFFLPIMPPVIPQPIPCIVMSGVFEILGGLGLLVPSLTMHRLAGLGLLLLLVAVFPANIYMATKGIRIHGVPSQPWMAWARLPLQPLLMLAVAWVSDLLPFPSAESP